jgi:transposase-like protein
MDDLSNFCCQNEGCREYGKRGAGNLSVCMRYGRNKARRLLYCHTCKARFSERKGTPLENSHLSEEKALSLLAHMTEGCGVRKTGRMAGVNKDTVTRMRR